MIVEDRTRIDYKMLPFSEINVGEPFAHQGGVFMKIEEVFVSGSGEKNCIALDGNPYFKHYFADAMVYPLHANLIVKKYIKEGPNYGEVVEGE